MAGPGDPMQRMFAMDGSMDIERSELEWREPVASVPVLTA